MRNCIIFAYKISTGKNNSEQLFCLHDLCFVSAKLTKYHSKRHFLLLSFFLFFQIKFFPGKAEIMHNSD